MKKSINTMRIPNKIEKEIREAVSIYSNAPTVRRDVTGYYVTLAVFNEHTDMLTFAEIDTVREVVDKYANDYKGISYTMKTTPIWSSLTQDWYYIPCMEVLIMKKNIDK